eukprot:COSAG02_NODE_312_length_24941_cov_60.672611_8_plen_55_part_00
MKICLRAQLYPLPRLHCRDHVQLTEGKRPFALCHLTKITTYTGLQLIPLGTSIP